MKVCNCTLPYFNGPEVCIGCQNNEFDDNSTYRYTTNPYDQMPKTKIVKKVTKTIEKYDKNGDYIGKEVITEEYENYEVYEQTPYVTWSSGTDNLEFSKYDHCTSVDVNFGDGTFSCIN